MDVRDFDDAELFQSLDWNRGVVVRKLDGLTLAEATRVRMPSGVTMLGIVKHLAWGERGWFEYHLTGVQAQRVSIDESFRVDSVTSVDEVIDDYLATVEHCRQIVAEQPTLEVRSVVPQSYFGIVTLRWMLLHMTKETARHAGHLDILRELTDGQTGY